MGVLTLPGEWIGSGLMGEVGRKRRRGGNGNCSLSEGEKDSTGIWVGGEELGEEKP